MTGVDLNQYRNLPNYAQLKKDGYEFAIIKLATGVSFTNPLFQTQFSGCKSAGLNIGVYTRADKQPTSGAQEAAYALNILGNRHVDFPIYYDVEGETLNLSKGKLTQLALDFGEAIKRAGYRWGIYTSRAHFKCFDLDKLKEAGASIWCAAYDTQAGMECDIWQKSDKGSITGYSGPVDVDVLYNESIIQKEENKMSLNLIKCFQTQGAWYNQTTNGTPVGVCWHDTGAGNPTLKRYVQPSANDPDYNYFINLIGKNNNGNHWNRMAANQAGLNAWIGQLADGSVATIQAGPWEKRPWGVGSGRYGSLNGDKNVPNDKFWIQFEICDDYAHNQPCRRSYFEQAYQQAVEFTAYICQLYNIDPFGTANYRGHDIPTICCHYDSYKFGFGSNHGDVYQWFNRFGKTMDDVRRDVGALMGKVVVPDTPDPVIPSQPSRPSNPYPTLRVSAHGAAVKAAQQRLIAHGYDVGSAGADGWFGEGTLKAVKRFQSDKGLTVDGIIGSATWTALNKEPEKKEEPVQPVQPSEPAKPVQPSINRPTIGVGDSGAYVKEAQSMLKKLGYNIGSYGVDGVFGNSTKGAVLNFQKKCSLDADGIVGPNTWAELDKQIAALSDNSTSSSGVPFLVRVNSNALNIRKGPGTNYAIARTITDRGTYTIVEVSGDWGKLKSGAGWINLNYTTRV